MTDPENSSDYSDVDEENEPSQNENENEINIYEILGLPRDILQKDIKKKYHVACLKYEIKYQNINSKIPSRQTFAPSATRIESCHSRIRYNPQIL